MTRISRYIFLLAFTVSMASAARAADDKKTDSMKAAKEKKIKNDKMRKRKKPADMNRSRRADKMPQNEVPRTIILANYYYS